MPSCLALFVSLHLCTFTYMFMHVSLCMLVYVIKLGSMILCRFTLVLDTQDPESLLGTLFDNTCVVYTPISWNCGHPIHTYICSSRTPLLFDNMLVYPSFGSFCSFVLSHAFLPVVFFACLLVLYFSCCCMCTFGARMLEVRT